MAQWPVADRGRIYGEAYEARQRDPVVDVQNRASVANGRMSRWERFNRGQELVYVNDAEGNPRGLTPKQYQVYQLALEMIDTYAWTMREMAQKLNVAPSTVSRALTKLSSWGIIAYIVGRGRWAGLAIIKRSKDDGFEHLRRAAKDRIRGWYKAAERRVSRLAANVAPYITEEGMRVLQNQRLGTSSKGATLTVYRQWTPDELRDLGIL